MSRQRLFGLVAWLVLAVVAGEASARTIYVKPYGSGSRNGQSWADAYDDLQDALAAAEAGDELWVAGGSYKPTEGDDRSIVFAMRENVEIYGGFLGNETAREQRNWTANETILSGGIGHRINPADNSFNVISGRSGGILDGFVITDAVSDGIGGGMINIEASPTVNNCTFRGNKASRGGGVYNSGGTPTFNNCVFTSNTASLGGGLYNKSASPTLNSCVLTSNSAGEGGGTYDEQSHCVLYHCTVAGNSRWGINLKPGSRIELIDCVVQGNADAGLVCDRGSCVITDCTFRENTSSGSGGAIKLTKCQLTMVNCTLSSNTSGLFGGAIYADEVDPLAIKGSRFTANKGGGIYAMKTAVELDDCVFERNSAHDGGAVRIEGADSTIRNCHFTGNSSGALRIQNARVDVSDSRFVGNENWRGGAVHHSGRPSSSFRNCVFEENRAGEYGGAICFAITDPVVENCTFVRNRGQYGGGIAALYCGMEIRGSAFVNNDADLGGGMNSYFGSPKINDCSFIANRANSAGGLYCGNSTISNCEFKGNSASIKGGGAVLVGTPTMSGCRFVSNFAGIGGGLSLETNPIPSLISNCSIEGNFAGMAGGIEVAGGAPLLMGCVITGNVAANSATSSGGGVAFRGADCFATMRTSVVADNFAGGNGGGIWIELAAPEIENCVIAGNRTEPLGGEGIGGGIYGFGGSFTMTNCTLVDNHARTSGGGIESRGGNPLLKNCILWSNAAMAGAEYAGAGSNSEFDHCNIRGGGGSGSGWDGGLGSDRGGNRDAEPRFLNPAWPVGPDGVWMTLDDGLQLRNNSPCADAGSSKEAPAVDILGTSRVGAVDIGSYEYVVRQNCSRLWELYR